MSSDPLHPVVLNYESSVKPDDDPLLRKMRLWQIITCACGLCMLGGSFFYDSLILLCPVLVLCGSIVTFFYMTRAAYEWGFWYAVRQLGLAIVLMPVFFLGVVLVP